MISEETKNILIKQLSDHEGVKKTPYVDTVGIWTVGIGRNLKRLFTADEEFKIFGKIYKYNYEKLVAALKTKPLTKDQVEYLFLKDLNEHLEKLYSDLPWVKGLDEVRQAVLINMAFNLGNAGLLSFKNTLKMIKDGDYVAASNAMRSSKWASQVKGRAVELCDQMASGEFALKYKNTKS